MYDIWEELRKIDGSSLLDEEYKKTAGNDAVANVVSKELSKGSDMLTKYIEDKHLLVCTSDHTENISFTREDDSYVIEVPRDFTVGQVGLAVVNVFEKDMQRRQQVPFMKKEEPNDDRYYDEDEEEEQYAVQVADIDGDLQKEIVELMEEEQMPLCADLIRNAAELVEIYGRKPKPAVYNSDNTTEIYIPEFFPLSYTPDLVLDEVNKQLRLARSVCKDTYPIGKIYDAAGDDSKLLKDTSDSVFKTSAPERGVVGSRAADIEVAKSIQQGSPLVHNFLVSGNVAIRTSQTDSSRLSVQKGEYVLSVPESRTVKECAQDLMNIFKDELDDIGPHNNDASIPMQDEDLKNAIISECKKARLNKLSLILSDERVVFKSSSDDIVKIRRSGNNILISCPLKSTVAESTDMLVEAFGQQLEDNVIKDDSRVLSDLPYVESLVKPVVVEEEQDDLDDEVEEI